jgi:hypothetical protein
MTQVKTLSTHFNAFNSAIKNRESINFDSEGNWYREGLLMRIVRWIFCLENNRAANVAQAFCNFLDQQEKIPVQFSATLNATAARNALIKSYIATANLIKASMKPRLGSGLITEKSNLLNRRIVALQYRCEESNGGWKKADRLEHVPQKFRALAQNWKNGREILDPHEKPLTKEDEGFLQDAMQYPGFIDQLYVDSDLQEAFFKWTVRDHNSAEVFIEFPGLHKRIKESYLSLRLGRYRNEMIRIEKQALVTDPTVREKVVTVPFEGKRVSILDDNNKVVLTNNYTITIKQFFDIFKDKNHCYGNLEVFVNGVNNWRSSEMGRYNPSHQRYDRIDLREARKEDWWKQLPSIGEISLDEGKKRYGDKLDGTNWGGKILSTREKRDRSLKGNHAYVDIAIPNENRTYSIYQFTKSADILPRHWWEYLGVVAKTFKGRILYPEVSPSHPLRQHKGWGFTMTPEEGLLSTEWLRKSIRQGLMGNLAYQLLTENCAKWSEGWRKVLPHKIPRNLFLVRFNDSEPEGAAGKLFWVVNRLSLYAQNLFYRFFFYLLGSKTSHTVIEDGKPRVVSLSNDQPWLPDNEFRIPGMLIERLDNGELILN